MVVFRVDAGDAVVGVGNEEGVVEPDLEWSRLDGLVPVDGIAFGSKAEVPFSDDGGGIAGVLEKLGESVVLGRDGHGGSGAENVDVSSMGEQPA